VTGHGITRAYPHLFKILEHATCPCGKGDQTIDHLIKKCPILHTQKALFRRTQLKTGNSLASKHEIITRLEIYSIFYKINKF